MTADADEVSVFWTSEVTPSVTSWSSASTSFVSRLMMHAGAVALVEAERQALEVPEELVAQVGEHALARPAGEVRLRRACDEADEAGGDEQRRRSSASAVRSPFSIRRRPRAREVAAARARSSVAPSSEPSASASAACTAREPASVVSRRVGARPVATSAALHEWLRAARPSSRDLARPVSGADPPCLPRASRRRRAGDVRRACPRPSCRASRAARPARRTRARAARARRSRGRRRSSRSARRACRARPPGRRRARRSRRRARSSTAGGR